jgi:hypothetical protein
MEFENPLSLTSNKIITYEAKNSTTDAIIYKCYTICVHIFKSNNNILFKPTQKMKLNLVWKNAGKNDTRNKIPDAMNKIIPHRRPFVTIFVRNP